MKQNTNSPTTATAIRRAMTKNKMGTTTSVDQQQQLYISLPYLPFLSNLSLTKKVYSLGHDTGHTIHNFLSTSHQINTIRELWQVHSSGSGGSSSSISDNSGIPSIFVNSFKNGTRTSANPKDLFTVVLPSILNRYKKWWLELVSDDPVHVLIETLLVSFLLYLLFVRKKEKDRKRMQDRLSDEEIEDLLVEWKERGRFTLTGVPIEEEGKVNGIGNSNGTITGSGDVSNLNGKGKKLKMNEVVIESMHGSYMTVKVKDEYGHGHVQQQQNNNNQKQRYNINKLTGKKDRDKEKNKGKEKNNKDSKDRNDNSDSAGNDSNARTMTVLNFATHDFLGLSCPAENKSDGAAKSSATAATGGGSGDTSNTNNNSSNPNGSPATENASKDETKTPIKKGSHDVIKEASIEALNKYGCGSCGPRGFYGTIDAHLDLEDAVTNFLHTDGAILYSDGAAASASTVAAFAKRGDLLVVDEGVYEALGTGVILSRANVKYFKHNDMEDLRRVLERVQATDESLKRKKNDQRRFIVVEALYKNYGTLCPLDELIQLKEEFCYRLILDESYSFGSLGETGRGALEYYNLEHMRHAEIVTFSLENSMGSIGGITVGNEEVVDHQRLSGAGYCFSASLPPFLAHAAKASLSKMEAEPSLLETLRDNVEYCYSQMHEQMSSIIPEKVLITSQVGISPIIYLQLTKNDDMILSRDEQVDLLDRVATYCLENGLFVISTGNHVYDHLHKIPPPSIRITIMAKHSKAEIDTAIKVLENAMSTIL